MSSELVLHDAETGAYAFYTWRNILIACWSKPATGPAMQRMRRLRETLGKQHPEGVSVVYLIADGAGLPTAEAREEGKRLAERYREQRACLVMLVYGEGFWLSAMRATLTGDALIRTQAPMKICSRPEEVSEWLPAQHENRTGVRVEPGEFLSVLRALSEGL